ncbi:succinyl-diaminopimelate desuccinylase [Helicobacter didelphidarum]|uniref:Succinyl-diaminopimelate desuccinylase n=1 Tax=Helicobacter didelphidarum TaxID=2040648 RepID=A0A3D8IP67_9HELI|nr:succinyl-diaminopimelate desuccinylase [Helicobacter didelphidarum]RDU67039.1 succinyl-diaminopimelate desuccinylase [Helicobacter didelphidarum]
MTRALSILYNLIWYPTITPNECDVYEYIKMLLPHFKVISAEQNGVKNLFLYSIPDGCEESFAFQTFQHFCFAGHIDVVPPGGNAIAPFDREEKWKQMVLEQAKKLDYSNIQFPINTAEQNEKKGQWIFPPFMPTLFDGHLYGRGAQDMKGGVACFLSALQIFFEHNPSSSPIYNKNHNPQQSITPKLFTQNAIYSILLTSDEEGPGIYGTKHMLEFLKKKNMLPTHVIVAEPTSDMYAGDVIKVGRRGSINGVIYIDGKQGHVAYPEKCDNPVEMLGERLGKLAGHDLDCGDNFFSPSKLVITDIRGGIETTNVTPSHLKIMFNVRNSTCTTLENVRDYIDVVLHGLPYHLELQQSSKSFLTTDSNLIEILQGSVYKEINIMPKLSTSGGTSDARFFSEYGIEVVEIGVCNDRIHAVNECVSLSDIESLEKIFVRCLKDFNEVCFQIKR